MGEYAPERRSGRIRLRLLQAENIYRMPAIYKCPVMAGLSFSYTYEQEMQLPVWAMTRNNFEEKNITEDAGKWHRQVSLLSYEKIEDFKKKGAPVVDGAFGENLTVQGIDLKTLPIGTRLQCNEVLLEVTQIGKQCHSGCEIFKVMGECIMPREGIFARVLKGGVISEGDEINVVKRPFRAAILTSSDSGYAGEREDLSGPTIRTWTSTIPK